MEVQQNPIVKTIGYFLRPSDGITYVCVVRYSVAVGHYFRIAVVSLVDVVFCVPPLLS
jgi:hypothetical protein